MLKTILPKHYTAGRTIIYCNTDPSINVTQSAITCSKVVQNKFYRPHQSCPSRSFIDALLVHKLPKYSIVPNRTKYYNNRHRDPKYRAERGRKVWKVELPDFDKIRRDEKTMSPEQVRSQLKEKGIAPPQNWNEKEMFTPCTMTIIDPYKYTDGDGKSSSLLDRFKSPLQSGKALIRDRREISALKSFEGDDFDAEAFAKQSTEIYIKAHEALASKDEDKIFDYVTEHCFPMITAGLKFKTMVWKYLGDVEPPETVQIRSGDVLSKGNKYSQLTVRMHTKQILAIYDRHGRLVHGSPIDVKSVLEYIVFEKYLANEYGLWRIHDRIKSIESRLKAMAN